MTKEEYHTYLNSDYWKGFSYSIIKERNFTCEDCGRSFPNQRNKLQIHHLVYRDVPPWSYKPEEMVVLCETCHKKRHGIIVEPKSQATNKKPPIQMVYQDELTDYLKVPIVRWIVISMTICLVITIIWGCCSLFSKKNTSRVNVVFPEIEQIEQTQPTLPSVIKESSNSRKQLPEYVDDKLVEEKDISPKIKEPMESVESEVVESEGQVVIKPTQTTSIVRIPTGSIDDDLHAEVVERARKAGVSTEGTTTEILSRITHAEVVERAKKAGVSTEGTTTEILSRINHADVVERARKAGVSTEGTTTEILKRINQKK